MVVGAVMGEMNTSPMHLIVGISLGQWNLMKTYHNEANTGGITKIASKNVLEFFH